MSLDLCGELTPYSRMKPNPTPEAMKQWERQRGELVKAQSITLQWLQAIQFAKQTGEQLAFTGYAVEGMELTTTAAKLECNPPAEFLQILLDWPKPQ